MKKGLICLYMEPVNSFQSQTQTNFLKGVLVPAVILLVLIVAGVASGWYLSGNKIGGIGLKSENAAPGADVSFGGKEVGLDDTKTFRDSATGKLEEGGIDGEGTHHLTRDGGPSQNVYLTSSVVDLSEFVGSKVEVWGETFGAKKAGWLMDVGKIKILD